MKEDETLLHHTVLYSPICSDSVINESLLMRLSPLEDDGVEIVEINNPNAPTDLSTSHKKQAYP